MRERSIKDLSFVCEQDGTVEREFKQRIVNLLNQYSKPYRAYLVRVNYGSRDVSFNVALCFATANSEDPFILERASEIFQAMFGRYEHLDMIFLSLEQEQKLRKVCTPFFTSQAFRFPYPDFYMIADEGQDLQTPRSCFKHKRLYGEHPDGFVLCAISPSIIGQSYGLGGRDIEQVILCHRHANYSLFPIVEWPAYVRILLVKKDFESLQHSDEIKNNEYNFIARAQLYENLSDINLDNYTPV